MYGTHTSDGRFVGFVAADHYEKLAARKRAAKAERSELDRENRLRVAAGLAPLRGQGSLFGDDAPPPRQKALF
jgi:hypothetical protein